MCGYVWKFNTSVPVYKMLRLCVVPHATVLIIKGYRLGGFAKPTKPVSHSEKVFTDLLPDRL